MTDVLPANTTFVSASASCTNASGTVTCTSTGLALNASTSWTITILPSVSITGNLINTASIATTSTPDPVSTNNSATDTDTPASADLAVTKDDGAATYTPGTNVTYTIGVTNSGPNANAGFTVTDVLPANTSFVSASTGCVNASGTVTCTSAGLALNASTSWTITVLPSAGRTGTLANTASIATTSTPDPNSANNTATDTDTIAPSVDLGVTITDGTTTYIPGGSTTYTVVVNNTGPSAANGATFSLPLPTGVTSGAWTAVTTGGATAGTSGSGAINDTVSVPVGGTVTYTFVAQISAGATGSLTANAAVTAASGTTDTNLANNSASDVDTAASADLVVTKTDGAATYTPGTNVTYTIGVTNAGPNANTGFTVTDVLPANTSFVSATAGCVNASGTVTCTSAGLALNGSTSWTITVLPASGRTGTLVNTASIGTTNTMDPNPANNTATDTDTIAPSVDLGVTITDGTTTYIPGGSTTYTVVVTNAGPQRGQRSDGVAAVADRSYLRKLDSGSRGRSDGWNQRQRSD